MKIIKQINDFDLGITHNIKYKGFQDFEWFDIDSEPWVLKANNKFENIINTLNDDISDFVSFFGKYFCITDDSIYIIDRWVYKVHDISNYWVDLKVYKGEMYWSWDNDGIWKTTLTELDWAIWTWDTTITVDDTTNFPSSWDLVIDTEVITYTGKTATTFTGCTRWANGSTASTHRNNSDVLGFIDEFQTFDVQYLWSWKGKQLKVFNNRLYATDGYSVSERDWLVWTNNAFVLPENDIITSIEELETQLCFWTSTLSGTWIGVWWGNLYFWDWVSANATNIIRTHLQWITALKEFQNTLYVFPWTEWEIYRFNGADLIKVIQIPSWSADSNTYIKQNAVKVWGNWLLFGTRSKWLYQLNNVVQWENLRLHKYWVTSTGDNENINCIYVINTDGLFIWFDESIDQTSSNHYQKTETTIVTEVIDLTNNKNQPTKVNGISVDWYEAFNNRWEIDIYYKTDYDVKYNSSNWQSLWTIYPDDDRRRSSYMLRWINRRAKYVMFKFNIWRTSDSTINIWIKWINII